MNHRTRKKTLKMNRCKYCFSTENLTLDHKIALKHGGKDEPSNFQCLCWRCNGTKSDLDHGKVVQLARWIFFINEARKVLGKRPLGIRNKDLNETKETTP